MRTEREVIQWLRDKGVVNKFFYCFKHNRHIDCESVRDLVVKKGDMFIMSAFSWSETPEGFSFWSEIDSKFEAWY